jgi:N-acyl homoserine lactone hydrolase
MLYDHRVADDIRLYLFECGIIRLPRYVVNAGDALNGDRVDNPTPWYLLTHPRGNVVIDGGNAPEVAEDPVKHWGLLAERSPVLMRPDQALLPELERVGVSPESVRWVVQSHLHLDHTGALAVIDRLPNAEVLVTRTEYDTAHNLQSWERAAYCPADYVKPGVPWTLLEDGEDGYDLFGDGTLRCWRTPGHTAGHLSFEVRLQSGAVFLLAVDAANTMEHLNETQTPTFMLSIADATRSVRRLRRLAWRSQARVVPGHDPDEWPSFKLAPEYYA